MWNHCFSSSKLVCKCLNLEKPDDNDLIVPPFSQEYTSLLASGELKEKQSAKVN